MIDRRPFELRYSEAAPTLENTGHTVQAKFEPVNELRVNGESYRFAQVHYHAPTELEPNALDDDTILEHLGHLGIRKVTDEVPSIPARGPDSIPTVASGDRFVVWATDTTGS